MEQVFDRLIMFIKQIAAGHELFSPDLAVFLVCLHEFDVKVYDALCHSDETYVHPITNMNKDDPGVFYFTKQIYGDRVHEMLNQIDRSITPELLEIGSFSYFFLDEDINEKYSLKIISIDSFMRMHRFGFMNNMPLIHKMCLHLKQILIWKNSSKIILIKWIFISF